MALAAPTSTTTRSPVLLERGVPAPMRDGTRLLADVWRPADEAAHPVLLQRTPYDRTASLVAIHHAGLEPARAVAAGFAVVVQDVRGRHGSEGTFAPFRHEAADGADTVAWVREQPWCDGRVCAYGTSYPGAASLLLAAAAPDGLAAACATECAPSVRDGWTHPGGALQWSFLHTWASADLARPELARRTAAGADVAADAAALDARLRDPRAALDRGPTAGLAELDRLVPALGAWIRGDPAADVRVAPGRGAVPTLHVGGWFDLFLAGTLDAHATLGRPAHLVVGPWAHGVTGSAVGELDFGPDAAQDALDLTAVQLGFVAAALAGELDAIPPVRLFLMGADRWIAEDAWPPARSRPTAVHLRAGGTLTRRAPDPAEAPERFAHDPADPVPTTGGAVVLPGVLGRPGPADQRAVEARADVLTWTSAPLPAPLELIGAVSATLWTTSTARATDWAAKLVDVHPDGRAMSVCDGIARTRQVPGRPTRHDIAVGATALRLEAGHRLRVEVASTNAPRFAPHPDPAGQVVLHDAARPSHLVLPVASGELPA